MSLNIPSDVYEFYHNCIDEKLQDLDLKYEERLRVLSFIMYPCVMLNYYAEAGVLLGLMKSIDAGFVNEEALNLVDDSQSNLVYDMVQVYQVRYYGVLKLIDLKVDDTFRIEEGDFDMLKEIVYLKIREILLEMMVSNESAYLNIVRYLSEEDLNKLLDQIFSMDGYNVFI